MTTLGLRLAGWQFETDPPPVPRCVVLAVPHTSNWDGLLLLALARSIGLEMSWMIKDSWLRGPMGTVMRQLGAVGIDRAKANNMVQAMVDEFARRDRLVLVIPPEGTRSRTDYWKSGFYRIALGAGVPVVPGYLDFARKRGGLGPPIDLTGDVHVDMDAIRAFYAAQAPTAHRPGDVGPIRLRDEDTERA